MKKLNFFSYNLVPKKLYDSKCDIHEDVCISNTQCQVVNETLTYKCGCLEGHWWNKTHCSIF